MSLPVEGLAHIPLTFQMGTDNVVCIAGLIITLDYIFSDNISLLLGLDVLAPMDARIHVSEKRQNTFILTDGGQKVSLPLEMRRE